jgi:hypothetical protein
MNIEITIYTGKGTVQKTVPAIIKRRGNPCNDRVIMPDPKAYDASEFCGPMHDGRFMTVEGESLMVMDRYETWDIYNILCT